MTAARLALGVVGLALGLWGGYELVATGTGNVVAVGLWLVGGVVVHDFVLAPVVVALVFCLAPVVPMRVRAVVAGAAVVLGTVTVTALPQLTRYGARADNPSLLDRDYTAGWLVFAGAVVVVASVVLLSSRVASRGGRTGR